MRIYVSLNLYCGQEDTQAQTCFHPSLWKRFREHIIWWIRQVCGSQNWSCMLRCHALRGGWCQGSHLFFHFHSFVHSDYVISASIRFRVAFRCSGFSLAWSLRISTVPVGHCSHIGPYLLGYLLVVASLSVLPSHTSPNCPNLVQGSWNPYYKFF